ncbi:autotransporter domain-containing protein [uncultured Erythrobacter sp.]|uniref:autotransporter domain-containing protein n=1 Tax=uncultured Erythrobacter sp. TaxID=263913 RepID=UPI00262328F2|nr:autotransporter domain-containing protein [uncultured Erythrobacter sp.]
MIKRQILSSVGVIGLAGGLMASPAFASEAEEDSESISLEAQGSFEGFRLEPSAPAITMPDMASVRARRTEVQLNTATAAPIDSFAGFQIEPRSALGPNIDFDVLLNTYITEGSTTDDIEQEIFVRDDVGLEASFDAEDTQPSVVQLFFRDNATQGVSLNCTGTVINPRTILTAAHCLNSRGSESYGLPETGAPSSILVGTGPDTSSRIFATIIDGVGYAEGGAAASTDVVIHPSANLENGALPFPFADIALIAVDAPITDVPAMPILLSPLTQLTHVVQVGYGSFGTGLGGPGAGSNLLRRVGENMLGAVASFADFDDAVFANFAPTAELGAITQTYYWTDFDWPDRDAFGFEGCTITPAGIEPCSLGNILATDWFEGDALPREVATAPGDSGSPLIVDELYEFPVATAVLSGGRNFFRSFLIEQLGFDNTYGDISFYNPIYPFFEFITQNTSYKYVSAKRGSGRWSDPNRWTQELDPGFFIDDGTGTLVNAIPEGEEDGIFDTGPNVGIIAGTDISDFPEIVSPFGPQPGDPNFGSELPESSVLLGPGSTGFVPNNTDGTPGTAFENPAQYFDVFLNRFGRTRVDMDVEIDKLTIDNAFASFVLPRQYDFTTVIGYEQLNGISKIDGTLNAGIVATFGGIFEGTGTVTTDAFFNLGGAVAPAGLFRTGTLTVDGAYVQASEGTLLANARFTRRRNTSDLLSITGDANLAGNLIVGATGRPRFGDEVTVLSANSIIGNFEDTLLISRSPLLFAESRVEGGDVIVSVDAVRLSDLFSNFGNLRSLGQALDTLRFGGRFTEFTGLFDVIDGAGVDTLVPTLSSLTPVGAFSQSTIATNFSQRFTGQLGQRTLSLRGANKAAAGFSSAGNAAFAIAGTNPQDAGKLGFFSTVSGSFLASAEERNTGANAFEEAAFTQAGELTLGSDLRVSDNFAVGFAMTSIRNSGANAGAAFRPDDTSVAGAAYAAAQFGQGFADMYVGFSRQNYGAERAASGDFALAYSSAQGAAEGRQTFGGMRVGYAIDVVPGFEFGPVASIDYVRSDIGGYDEFGAGAFGLSIHGRDFTSVGSKVGLMGSLDTRLGRTSALSAFGSVAYARELADTQDVVTASFFGAPDVPFSIVNELDGDWVSVNAGVELSLGNRFSLSASGTSDMGRGVLTNNQGRVTMSWKF